MRLLIVLSPFRWAAVALNAKRRISDTGKLNLYTLNLSPQTQVRSLIVSLGEVRGEADLALRLVQLPTFGYTPTCQPSTLKPRSLNPQPSILRPQPSTLVPKPKPHTLNPQPSTFNPQPSTLQPEP